MNILMITHKPPFPALDGGALAMESMLKALLGAGHEVDLISLSTYKHPAPKKWPEIKGFSAEAIFIDTKIKPIAAGIAFLRNRSYNLDRFKSYKLAKRIKEKLKEKDFDILHLESLFSMAELPSIRQFYKGPIVYRSHNLEYKIWEDLASSQSSPPKKFYLKKLAEQLKLEEFRAIQGVNGILAIQPFDAEVYRIKTKAKVQTLLPSLPEKEKKTQISQDFYHLGAMDWQPNIEGVQWLMLEVWPEFHAKYPKSKLHLAGRNMPREIQSGHGIHVHGEIDSVDDFIQNHGTCLIPLFSGAGVKMKFLEAAMAQKAVVSTPKGVEGLELPEGSVWVANERSEFLAAMKACVESPEETISHGEKLGVWAEENLTQKAAGKLVTDFYERIKESCA